MRHTLRKMPSHSIWSKEKKYTSLVCWILFEFLQIKKKCIQINFVRFVEKHNEDWWFVKKPLTEERGWVPSQYLMDADTYANYVQTKLNEKIDKLPVFESKFPILPRT